MKDQQDSYHFTRLLVIILGACLLISVVAAAKIGIGKAILLFLGLSVVGVIVAFILNQLLKGAGNVAGGLFLGSKKKDDKAILKGMYQQANGLKLSAQYSQAEKIYRQIIDEYPQETEAPFILANLLWIEMDRSKEAMKMLLALEKKIRLEKLPFKYRKALKQKIADLSSELASGN